MAVAVCASVGACGGERQDAGEASGSYKLEVVDAFFPKRQDVAQRQQMRIRVRNTDTKAIPAVSVTVSTQPGQEGGAAQPFSTDISDPAVADPSRPIWILDQPPGGGDTAVTNTWSLGRLAPGQTRTFKWDLTPVRPGSYVIDYQAGPSLTGKATAAAGARTSGRFRVTISDEPPQARVNDDGEVEQLPSSDAN